MALALARRSLGRTWPNPAVGCVISRRGSVVARGWTQPGGRPHAEAEALRRAGDAAHGADVFVTLEPCSHHGRTPPCADALIAAGIRRAVVAIKDPDPRVSGAGLARLRAAGVHVELGLEAEAAREITAGFLSRLTRGRPFVTLKLATSLDARIALASGESRWITGEAARARAHALRSTHDAVLVGIGTALADDPELTCRLPGREDHRPVRIVVDTRARLPLGGRLAMTAATYPVWAIIASDAEPSSVAALHSRGVETIAVDATQDGLDLTAALVRLGERGITRLLVEGGGRIAAAMIRAGLVDHIVCARAGLLIGADGVPGVAALGLDRLLTAPRYRLMSTEACGDDVVELWART
jgi:diaminohydroxyphosphoribosylaminopyrimidine deaminase/5-amino-6-(5-phosphoribosylamino)uracil reductase